MNKLPKLQTFIDQKQLQADLAFSDNNLSDAFMRHAALYAHYAQLAHKAEYQCDRCESAMKLVEARLRREIAKNAKEKLSIPVMDGLIREHADFLEAEQRYHQAKYVAGLVKEAANAFRQRKDMLVQMGAASREEMKGEMRMREIEVGDRVSKSRAARMLEVVSGAAGSQP